MAVLEHESEGRAMFRSCMQHGQPYLYRHKVDVVGHARSSSTLIYQSHEVVPDLNGHTRSSLTLTVMQGCL